MIHYFLVVGMSWSFKIFFCGIFWHADVKRFAIAALENIINLSESNKIGFRAKWVGDYRTVGHAHRLRQQSFKYLRLKNSMELAWTLINMLCKKKFRAKKCTSNIVVVYSPFFTQAVHFDFLLFSRWKFSAIQNWKFSFLEKNESNRVI